MRSRILPGWVARSQPATRAVPPLGASSVESMRSVVVLPAPLGPRKPKISPRRTSRSTPATASTCRPRDLNTRRRPRVSITASGLAPSIGGDFPGSRPLAAGEQGPEGLLCGAALAPPADAADHAHDRWRRPALEDAQPSVGGHRALRQRRPAKARERGRPHVLVVSKVQGFEAVVGVPEHLADVAFGGELRPPPHVAVLQP